VVLKVFHILMPIRKKFSEKKKQAIFESMSKIFVKLTYMFFVCQYFFNF